MCEVDDDKALLYGAKVKNFTSYHSIMFEDDGMRMWCYFDVGEGIFQPYLDVKFVSGIKIRGFSKTDAGAQSKTNSKQRSGRGLKKWLFCDESGCSEIFDDQDKFDKHVAEGRHTNAAEKSVFPNIHVRWRN